MQGVLANLNRVVIATEYSDAFLASRDIATDRTSLDNVRMGVSVAAVPEPSSVIVLGTGVAGLLACRRLRGRVIS